MGELSQAGGGLSENDMFSFTLSVALPTMAGLNLYDHKPCNEATDAGSDRHVFSCRDFGDGFRQEYHSYHVDELVVHKGLTVHQIAHSRYWGPGEVRLTLQGHGVCGTDACHVYW